MLRTLNALMINIDKSGLNTNKMQGKLITDILKSGKKAVFTVGVVSKKTKKNKKSHSTSLLILMIMLLFYSFYAYWSFSVGKSC